jgi:Ca2+-transporting ATPase
MTGSPGWHHRDAVEIAGEHGVDPTRGLDASDVAHRVARHGANELTGKEASSWLALLADQFKDFMVLVLIAAAVVSGAIGEPVDTLAFVVIVVLNAVIGFVQAWRADKAMAALQQLAAAHATVLRDGEVRQIPAAGLVPGDIVLLEAGNQVPADLRLIDLAQFRVDESALTGESVTVEKHTAPMTGVVHALGDRLNMAFKGTTATHGRARGLVVAIGMSTELGKVARLLDRDTDRSTPLQRRLAAFGKRLSLVVIAICVVIFTVGVLRGESPLLMALTAISLAVAAIPEALRRWSPSCWHWVRARWCRSMH